MAPQMLESRVDSLEKRVTKLERLPARIDALTLQVSQLRSEMHAEFSAMGSGLRAEMRAGDEGLGRKIDELGIQMRVLHEDVIGRFAVLGEVINGRKSRKAKRR